MRDRSLSKEFVDLGTVFRYSLEKIEEKKIFPDLLVTLEITFPFRPQGLLDEMILQLTHSGLDSVVAARRENRAIWKQKGGSVVQLDEGLTPRKFKEPSFMELRGVGCITHPEFVRQGNLLGERIGIREVHDPRVAIEVRNPEDLELASSLIKQWSPS